MREIRFRAWDWKKMRFPVNIPNIQDLWESILCEFENHNWIYIETCPPNWWKFEVEARMQYTWLKDKNWKEIYDGDIIYVKEEWRYRWEYNIPVEYAHNWWCFWCACVRAKEISHHKEVDSLFTRSFLIRNLWSFITLWEMTKWWFEFEIIWNIYENPELLAKK